MSEELISPDGMTCPMCGATAATNDGKCSVCGENLPSIDKMDAAPGDHLTDEEIRAFVGSRANYYVTRWQAVQAGKSPGFNWAAFFLSGLWLPYRKMYVATGLFFGIVLAESIAEEVLFVGILGKEVPAGFDRLTSLIAAFVCGAFGNKWYFSRIRREIANLKSQGMPHEAYLESLSRRGGTSFAASIGLFVLFVVVAIAAFVVLGMIIPGE